MTIQLELDFKTDYIHDLLDSLRWMAHIHSTASDSERISNLPAFLALQDQIHDLFMYAIDTLNSDYIGFIFQSRQSSIDLYWGV